MIGRRLGLLFTVAMLAVVALAARSGNANTAGAASRPGSHAPALVKAAPPPCTAYCGPRDETPHATTAAVHLASAHLTPDPLHARPVEAPLRETPPPMGRHITPLDPPPVL